MKILNLYAGIGGNRRLWPNDAEITAVELNPKIAEVYQRFYPKDKVIVEDAHQYLLDHFKEFDFIWSSPPCPTHSKINYSFKGRFQIKYPDMRLWQEIIFLKEWCETKWVVENVISYYEPFIKPYPCGRHYFWSNFYIPFQKYEVQIGTLMHGTRKRIIREAQIPELITLHGLDLKDFEGLPNKRQVLRNCVKPELGLFVFNQCFGGKQEVLA